MDKSSRFWDWFRNYFEGVSELSSTSDIVDQINEMLIRIDRRLALEVSDKDTAGLRELIISANGFEDLFVAVENLVDEAPEIDGWIVIALKPARGFDFVFKRDGLELTPAEWSFRPLEVEDHNLGLQILMPNGQACLDDWTLEVILESGVGEKQFSVIKHIESTQLPISDLANFLDFRNRRIGS